MKPDDDWDAIAVRCAAAAEQPRSDAYDKIDRYLRNNLDDPDYTEYSQALEVLYAAPVVQPTPAVAQAEEDAIEKAYWQFDARRKGYAEWKLCPQSERDAFKAEARGLLHGMYPGEM